MAEGTDPASSSDVHPRNDLPVQVEKLTALQLLSALKPRALFEIVGTVVAISGVGVGIGYWAGKLERQQLEPALSRSPPPQVAIAPPVLSAPKKESFVCSPVVEGGFDNDALGRSHSAAGWVFDSYHQSGGDPLSRGPDAEFPKDESRKSLRLSRTPPKKGIAERFVEPDRSDFTHVEWPIPKEWYGRGIRLNATLRWDDVTPFKKTGRTSTVAVNYMADVPPGQGLRETPLDANPTARPSESDKVFSVLIAETTRSIPWTRFTFPIYRLPSNAQKASLRIGLHAVYGSLYIDDLRFELCD